jgi:hypothetical protein
MTPTPAPSREPLPPTFNEDALLIAKFITGWWPGLEDGINWSNTKTAPVLRAARRIQGRAPLPPETSQ